MVTMVTVTVSGVAEARHGEGRTLAVAVTLTPPMDDSAETPRILRTVAA